jgi:hypothetical protein
MPSETGEAPIFWRTSDAFASVEAEQGYKVVLRVTNSFDEAALPLVATRGGSSVEFQARRAVPLGSDDEGSYYVATLVFPQKGTWQLTATAGADKATVPVEVASGGAAAG